LNRQSAASDGGADVMPELLLRDLTPQQVGDLLEILAGLR
jgi:hypothetical protein